MGSSRRGVCALGVVSVVFVGSLAACQEPEERPTDWSYIHAAIVVPSCATASCHSSLSVRAGIDLQDNAEAYELLLGEQFVVPGDGQSALMYLLEGDQRTRMPPDAPLPAADVELVRQWILDGAVNE